MTSHTRGRSAAKARKTGFVASPRKASSTGQKRVKVGAAIATAIEHHQHGRLPEAREIYQQIVEQEPSNARAWFGLGSVDAQRGDPYGAILSLERMMALSGPKAECHHNMASAKASVGRIREAATHYEEAIRLMPDYLEAYFNYVNIKRCTAEEGIHDKLEELCSKGPYSDADLCFLHFAAGKVYDDLGKYERAFEHYCKGNGAKKTVFSVQEFKQWVDNSLDVFDQERTGDPDVAGFKDQRFVFIVGMPRSGTTLVEQILASHSQVFGAGELPDIHAIAGEFPKYSASNAPYPECMRDLADGVVSGLGKAYAQRVASMAENKRRYVDKQPNNFRYLGLINALLPEARIIHCRRHVLDTCLSCYFQNFRGGQEFSFNLEDIAAYYGAYHRMMAHWKSTLPISILDVDYEDLVARTEETGRRLIKYLGLNWENGCNRFHETDRKIQTASRWQVRQSIYTRSVERWRNYERYLEPLTKALEAEGVSLGLTQK